MTRRINSGGLQIAEPLYKAITEAAAGIEFDPETFWSALAAIVTDLAPRNRELLAERDRLQAAIDQWHADHAGQPHDPAAYKAFLYEIGYLVPEGPDFKITTQGVDPEISVVSGPQLVVPVTNARYAVNAANSRWYSLYDALYGSDVIPEEDGAHRSGPYNPTRGRKVVDYVAAFLDRTIPLAGGSHRQAVRYFLDGAECARALYAAFPDGTKSPLADPSAFAGFVGAPEPSVILLTNHSLHIELRIDRNHIVGKDHPAGLCDVIMEAAVTTILDCEDSVAVVDGEDKALAYSNLLGLVRGDLTATFPGRSGTVNRRLNPDREYQGTCSGSIRLPGRSLMLVRNVGHLMTTDAVLTADGQEIPEGILDCLATALIFARDVQGLVQRRNSRTGSVYIVKPKMHGPAEVAFANELFNRAEDALELPRHTLKIGIMDEERRTTLNLKECIRAAKDRVIFINTGFLDRTGDEIHTSMEAGPVVRKNDMKSERWITAYEDWNVDVGLAAGFSGRAQIGKGMWAKPDMMAEMVASKAAHPNAGAACAWVPSPTAAALHAMHYHEVDVAERQHALSGQHRTTLDDLLTLPLLTTTPTPEAVAEELELNAQSILGYVVRWIDQGIGCSKVPDLHDVGLMEDRATLRISSQHIANWLRHNVCTPAQVQATLERMAAIVDRQNSSDPAYRPMAPDFTSSIAFQAARDLVLKGHDQPNGYTEPILHAARRQAKLRK